MRISQKGKDYIKGIEKLELRAYIDTKHGRVWTIGYGHTLGVKEGMTITEQRANELLDLDLFRFEDRVNRLVKVPLNQAQYDALVSFDFNTGALHKSTLLRKLNAGDYQSVPDELSRWVFDDGVKLKGLVRRRAEEAAMWVSMDEVNHKEKPSGEVKRGAPSIINKENVSWAAGIASTGAMSIPSGDGPIQWVIAAVIAIAFSVALYLFLKRRRA